MIEVGKVKFKFKIGPHILRFGIRLLTSSLVVKNELSRILLIGLKRRCQVNCMTPKNLVSSVLQRTDEICQEHCCPLAIYRHLGGT